MKGIVTYKECPLCKSEAIEDYINVKDYSFSNEEFTLNKCSNCQFVFTQNVPNGTEIAKYYQSDTYVSHSDTRKGLFFKLYHIAREIALKSKRKLIQQHLGKQNGSILDIGSATGYFLNHMKTNGFDVEGVEPDADSRKLSESNFNIKSNSPDDFFENNSSKFDVITMWHVLEHVHDLHKYVVELSKRIEDKGVIVIAVPNHNAVDREFFGKYWAAYDVPVHLWHFEPKTITKLFNQNGFDLIKKKSMPFDSFYVSMLSYKAKGNPLYMILGFIYGLIPFFTQMINVDSSTSITYIFKKK